MKVFDFEYDSLRLSSFGFMVCNFDSGGMDTVSNGSELSLNTISTRRGAKHELTSSEYEDCLTATFQICKHPCSPGNKEEISVEDMREIMAWLNRKEFHKLRFLDTEYSGIYFEASFNVSKVEMSGSIYGFELEMFTNRPFACQDDVIVNIKNLVANGTKNIFCKSDEEGFIYPDMKITINADGDFELYNALEDRTMKIADCTNGEVITINYPLIESSNSDHKIQNDFNWVFFRLASTFKNKLNAITMSLPCNIRIKYSPIAKVGI